METVRHSFYGQHAKHGRCDTIFFGIGHLPAASAIMKITPLIITEILLLNGIAGLLFGWLFWKKGLESAMIAHFTADIMIHVIAPLLGIAK